MTAMQRSGLVQLLCAAAIEANGDIFCSAIKVTFFIVGAYLFAIRKAKPWEVE